MRSALERIALLALWRFPDRRVNAVFRVTDDTTPRRPTARPERVMLPPSDEIDGYLLEMFELGDGPIGTCPRHAVWLHRLKTGSYCWKCSCGAQKEHRELDAALLAEARAHFDEAWEPAAVPIGSAFCLWNDRVQKEPPPTAEDLARLARDLFAPPDELARRRFRKTGDLPPGVEVAHVCGICGEAFRITRDDPHWSTGRGPICPQETK